MCVHACVCAYVPACVCVCVHDLVLSCSVTLAATHIGYSSIDYASLLNNVITTTSVCEVVVDCIVIPLCSCKQADGWYSSTQPKQHYKGSTSDEDFLSRKCTPGLLCQHCVKQGLAVVLGHLYIQPIGMQALPSKI